MGTLVGAAALAQALLWAAPGDPIDLLPDPAALRPVLEREWGLSDPLPVRLLTWLGRALTGDLGTSLTYRPGTPVTEILAGPTWTSLTHLLPAWALAMGLGTALASWTGGGHHRAVRRVLQGISVTPLFLLGFLLITGLNEWAFSRMEAGLMERPGWFALPDEASLLRSLLAVVVLAVSSGGLSEIHAAAEEHLERIRSSGFVDAARARGTPTWPHVALHLLHAAGSVAADRAAFFIGGLVILERVFSLNGVGTVLWRAAESRDYPLALGATVLCAAGVALARFAADVLRTLLDPRMRSA